MVTPSGVANTHSHAFFVALAMYHPVSSPCTTALRRRYSMNASYVGSQRFAMRAQARASAPPLTGKRKHSIKTWTTLS